jgi:enolase-phosphatase E1
VGDVYPDVAPALQRWQEREIDVAIFSSGSIQAQRDLFGHSTSGDLTPFIRAYFDTTTGPKSAPPSYSSIAAVLGHPPASILFVSDVAAELDAAHAAGMVPALCVRARNAPTGSPGDGHRVVHTLADL